jgi:antitoxin MazE
VGAVVGVWHRRSLSYNECNVDTPLTLNSNLYKLVDTLGKVVRMTAQTKASVSVDQIVQEWGNSLAVRITGPVAKAARLARGMPIKLDVVNGEIRMRPVGKPKLTLAQKLKAFDPDLHGGEVMATGRVGAEIF